MQRRKFLIGAGSLAAASAGAIGTGAFTSVSASRSLVVETAADNNALLGIERQESSSNADEYVDNSGNAIAIDFSSDDGGTGVNSNAYSIFRDLLKITNQGSQTVYVWFEGLPDGVRVFHDDSDFTKAADSGNPDDYTGNLSNPGTGRFQPDDPDASDSDLYYSLPDLGPGDALENVGMLVDTRDGDVSFDGTITVVAKTLTEAES